MSMQHDEALDEIDEAEDDLSPAFTEEEIQSNKQGQELIQRLRNMGINVMNTSEGTRQLIAATSEMSLYQISTLYETVVGRICPATHELEATTLLRYIGSEAMRKANGKEAINMTSLINTAKARTAQFFVQFPYLVPGFVSQLTPTVEVSTINPITAQLETARVPVKKSGGDKKVPKSELAFQYYQENKGSMSAKAMKAYFMAKDGLGLSTAGANTYMTNCKKRAGDI